MASPKREGEASCCSFGDAGSCERLLVGREAAEDVKFIMWQFYDGVREDVGLLCGNFEAGG